MCFAVINSIYNMRLNRFYFKTTRGNIRSHCWILLEESSKYRCIDEGHQKYEKPNALLPLNFNQNQLYMLFYEPFHVWISTLLKTPCKHTLGSCLLKVTWNSWRRPQSVWCGAVVHKITARNIPPEAPCENDFVSYDRPWDLYFQK